MPNMRIISTNLTDTTATINATNRADITFDVANVKNDYKSSFHRSASGTKIVQYSLTWSTAQTIGGVSLPCTNLTSAATIRVELFNNATFTAPTITGGDSGSISACTSSPIANLTTSTPTGSLFQLGVLSKSSVWFPSNIAGVLGLRITISDTGNPASSLDVARIVCGSYWQPTYNASREGLDLNVVDTSTSSRTDAGDLVSDRGYINDELSLNLGLLTDTDRNNLLQIMRTVGTNRNILVSVFPTDYNASGPNNLTEQHYTVYGKRSNSNLNYVIQGYSSSSMQITGW